MARAKHTPKPIATFEAWVPPIASAILIGNDGAQVKLQIPEEGVAEVQKLIASGRNRALFVSIFGSES